MGGAYALPYFSGVIFLKLKKFLAGVLALGALCVPVGYGISGVRLLSVFADDTAGPSVVGYGVQPSAFEYAGYKMVPWDLKHKTESFDISDYMQRANDDNSNAFSRAMRSCSAAGYPYIMIIDTYKCIGSSSIYNRSGMTYIYAFKSTPVFTMVECSSPGVFVYKSTAITQSFRRYHVYGDSLCSSSNYQSYGYFPDGYDAYGVYDHDASMDSPYFLYIAENFSGMRFENSGSVSGVSYYSNSDRAVNIFTNFDPQISDIEFSGGQTINDGIFTGQHTGSVTASTTLSGSIDTSDTSDVTISINNGKSDSIQYCAYISASAVPSSDSIVSTYRSYKWCYQTYQNCKIYRGSISQSVVDSTINFLDIFGESFPLSRATKTPLYMLLNHISDSKLLGVYTDSYLSCPYHFISSGNTDTLKISLSELPLSAGQTYYLNVIYRDTTVQAVAPHHRATYAHVYYDDISQLDNYSVVLSSSFSLTTNIYTAPATDDSGKYLDDSGNIKTDSNGNPISNSKNYSSDVISVKNGNAASDAYATGGNASATGGSASVVNNNNPVFNNKIPNISNYFVEIF